jgi:hypothetical protein
MKAHNPLRRVLLAFSLVGCICALALPAAAGARPIIYHPVSQLTATTSTPAPTAYHPHGRPSAYSPLDERSAKVTTTGGTPSVVVRQVRTVTNGPDHTLAIVLASCALGIALCGTAYAVSRTSRLQRSLAGSK